MILQLYQYLSLETHPFTLKPDNLNKAFIYQFKDYSYFYQGIYKKYPEFVFPPCIQTIFLDLWDSETCINEDDTNFKVHFLKQIYAQNQGLFWLPVIACVLQQRPIPLQYWVMAKYIKIPPEDAASYIDFLYRWVFPTTFTKDDVRPILMEFRGNLTEVFGPLVCHFDPVAHLPYYLD
jgi:hypothetical protein